MNVPSSKHNMNATLSVRPVEYTNCIFAERKTTPQNEWPGYDITILDI